MQGGQFWLRRSRTANMQCFDMSNCLLKRPDSRHRTWLSQPFQELRDAIHLIVMLSVWEQRDLTLKLRDPTGIVWDSDLTSFDKMRNREKTRGLVVFGDEATDADVRILTQILKQLNSRAGLFNQDQSSVPPIAPDANASPEFGKLQPHPVHIEQPG